MGMRAVFGQGDDRLALAFEPLHLRRRLGAEFEPLLAQERDRADDPFAAAQGCAHAGAGQRFKMLGAFQFESAQFGRPGDGLGQRMLAVALDRGGGA